MYVQLSRASDVGAMQSIVEQLASVLEMAGSFHPVCSASDRDKVVTDTCNWYCFGRSRPAFDRSDMQLLEVPLTVIMHYIFVVDRTVFCSSIKTPLVVVTLLFAVYFLFNIEYPPQASATLEFIQR